MRPCAVRGCMKPAWKLGLCTTHFNASPTPYTSRRDTRAIAYWTGVIDARHGRPPRCWPGDPRDTDGCYTRGYHSIHIEAAA